MVSVGPSTPVRSESRPPVWATRLRFLPVEQENFERSAFGVPFVWGRVHHRMSWEVKYPWWGAWAEQGGIPGTPPTSRVWCRVRYLTGFTQNKKFLALSGNPACPNGHAAECPRRAGPSAWSRSLGVGAEWWWGSSDRSPLRSPAALVIAVSLAGQLGESRTRWLSSTLLGCGWC